MNATLPPEYTDDDEIDLLELWEVIREKWLWIFAITLTCSVASVIVALLMTPIYRAEVVMIPAGDNQSQGRVASLAAQFGGLADLAGVSLSGGGSKDEALTTLQSRTLITTFIKERQLLPVLFADEWDAAAGKWLTKQPEEIPTLNDANELMNESILQVSEDKKTGVITVAIEWSDRQLAAQWANEIVLRTNQSMRERAIKDAEASIEYLNKELRKTSVIEIQQAIYRLIEANYKTASIANTREEYVFRVIDPATPPDADNKVRPKRTLIVLLATLAGGFVSIIGVFMQRGWRNMKQRRQQRLAKE